MNAIFFTYYIGTIVQEIELSEPVLTNERNYLDEDEIEATMRKFCELISFVYRHPKDLVDVDFEQSRPDVAILTFNIKRNLQKDSLIAVMQNEILLIASLNEQFKKSKVQKLSKLSVIELSKPIYTENSGKIVRPW